MRYVYLAKKDLSKFIDSLKKKRKVVGPVKKENKFVFDEIEETSQLCLEYVPTILPLKKYFLPQKEVLGKFTMGETKMTETTIEVEPTVVIGAHTCDIDGLECLDSVFHTDPADPYYTRRKKSIVIIGYECMFPCDEHAVCVTMDTHVPKAGYDVMMTDAGDKYILHVNSKYGDEILAGIKVLEVPEDKDLGKVKDELQKLREDKIGKFKRKINAEFRELSNIFEKAYNSKVWEEVGKKCISCGNCTAVCPTCYCFDMYDDVTLDIKSGERKRVWDSCQLEEFAEVAGGENFREERSSRQRHRYYRKFSYSVKKYKKIFCTGCGRCTRTCMAGISLVDTINVLAKENKNV